MGIVQRTSSQMESNTFLHDFYFPRKVIKLQRDYRNYLRTEFKSRVFCLFE